MLESFTVAPGLEAKLWAGTELLHSPVAMDVDARGRVWVTEDLQGSGEKDTHARIKILEDSDRDGKADSVKEFGPTFSSKPMGISVFDNKIVVSMAPNIHVYTDINRDGMKQSPNFNETSKVADTSKCPVIISGGVSSIDDIKKARELNNNNIEGIIVGKAIYDGDIKLDELAKELDA